MECPICFDETSDANGILCGNPQCSVLICHECCEGLVSFSNANNVIPQCPGIDCKSYYLLSEIRKLEPHIVEEYREACFNYIIKDNGDEAKKKIEHEHILNRLREERQQFIREKFPAAVALVAQTAMGTKLRRIEKTKAKHIADKLQDAERGCMNLFCNGHLEVVATDATDATDLSCLTCDTTFCGDCEKRKMAGHKCKQEDVESVSFIRSLIRCPQCHLPVQKSEGCNSITCAHCGKNFDYATGKAGGHGSLNSAIAQAKTKRRMIAVYEKSMPKYYLTVLLKLEDLEPPLITIGPVTNILSKYYREELDRTATEKKIAFALSKFLNSKYKRKVYHNVLADIEDQLQKSALTIHQLQQAVATCNQL